ncbi:hypothetical protein D3OALGA1CA_1138 [Olavius algarvensis associated proteobacterium Delta 3]|nr:hypothetical protein D3OALGB2SA_1146 [Olavius algarvensis associated proteobacterium Delta 3]CAB5094891.1 hypothetical protein D3OALGA1CA_1138 [Olavius algarvensis associated proteobacterium Delta 3]
MIVKVLLKRYVPKEKESELLGLIRALRTLTTKQPGYVSGETFKRIDNPGESLVISIWQSLEDWERWVNSTERQVIQDQVDGLLGTKTEYGVYQYVKSRL